MRPLSLILTIGLAAVPAMAAAASISTVTVAPGTADLYLAGSPANRPCCAGDNSNAESPVLANLALTPGSYLTFTTLGSATHYPNESAPATADGSTGYTYNLTADYGTGISGPTNVHLDGLAGVFLGPSQPSGAAPAQLSGTDFTSISPGLDQIFFIGDGLTGTGTGATQQFFVPAGATRLYLGIIDDGGYYDNGGAITANVTEQLTSVSSAPEPSTWALLLGGIGILGAMMRVAHARRREDELKSVATA